MLSEQFLSIFWMKSLVDCPEELALGLVGCIIVRKVLLEGRVLLAD